MESSIEIYLLVTLIAALVGGGVVAVLLTLRRGTLPPTPPTTALPAAEPKEPSSESSGQSPTLRAAMGLGPVQGPARPGPYLWVDSGLQSLYYAIHNEAPLRPALPDGEWEQIDATIGGVVAQLREEARLSVAFVLTEHAAEECSSLTYVFFEPLADIVVVLSHVERDISISATRYFWDDHADDFRRLSNHVEHLLQDGRVSHALCIAAEGLRQIFLPVAPP